MKHITYKTEGTCSQLIDVDVDDNGIIQDVYFTGGCNGNLQGICSLVRGMRVEDVKNKLDGIRCGMKRTSCPDQLVRALEQLEAQPS
ncbi:MAG: TIGR03905 family TSCPD domain-containing protein [Prevotella sp.]|nr:TIGR03905 family TSCPD domain-containing protein [Prevotella sp.]